ncbi:MAG: hypothetical protein IJA33_03395, partial [Oscillospiraceae bacterium]|nr:hypothetical protein [Oscillospiraceae bacterium]
MTALGGEICLTAAYTYYTVIDGVVAEAHPLENYQLALPYNATGWIIMPMTAGDGSYFHMAGPGGDYTGTCENLGGLRLKYEYFNYASTMLDQFSFVKDVDAFKSLVVNDQTAIPGYVGKPALDVRADFADATDDTYVSGAIVDCASPFGQGMTFTKDATLVDAGYGSLAGYDVIRMYGNADAEAIAFYYDATTATAEVKVRFSPINAQNGGECIQGASPVVTIIDGVLNESNTSLLSENFTMKFPAGTAGWVVLDIAKTGHWGLIGEGPDTSSAVAALGICVNVDNQAVTLDQVGYVNDVAAFTAAAVAGNESLPGYTGKHTWVDATCAAPKTCSVCGITEGEPTDDHAWDGGVCLVCGETIYDVAEDFADIAVSGTEGAYEQVTCVSPYGPALKYTRTGDNCLINIDFDEAGTADYDALVFYYDNTMSGFGGDAKFRMRPYTS